jgi:hypothetical protein
MMSELIYDATHSKMTSKFEFITRKSIISVMGLDHVQ